MEAIKTLNINGKEVQAKGTIGFVKLANNYAGKTEVKGKEVDSDGIFSIFMGLMQRDPVKLTHFWHCATSNLTKSAVKLEQVEYAIEEYAEQNDSLLPLFAGALETMRESGMIKDKVNFYLDMMAQKAKKSKDTDEDMLETVQEMYQSITGKPLFNLNKKA